MEHLKHIKAWKLQQQNMRIKIAPSDNVIIAVSILMDLCAVMRGSKNGLEKLIRNRRAPQMLDIEGDSCHHIHNASKKFCSPFEHWVESLLSDLHTDHKWLVEMRDSLQEIGDLIGIHTSLPECYVPHRWLSVLEVSLDTLRLWDVFILFYYAFLNREDKEVYKETADAVTLRKGVQEEGKARIEEIWKELSRKSKNFTDEGRVRKARICRKVRTFSVFLGVVI